MGAQTVRSGVRKRNVRNVPSFFVGLECSRSSGNIPESRPDCLKGPVFQLHSNALAATMYSITRLGMHDAKGPEAFNASAQEKDRKRRLVTDEIYLD